MKFLFPINSTTKNNYLFYLALASVLLTLSACSTLAPATSQTANYYDERPAAANQKTNSPEPAYSWFY